MILRTEDHTNAITVITLTRERPELLSRATTSVYNQDYKGFIEHLVVIDDDDHALNQLSTMPAQKGRKLSWHMYRRSNSESDINVNERESVYPRIARLLNIGVSNAKYNWIAFLDDDNEFEPNHLSSLMECAIKNDCKAVHSARKMLWPDGTPYLEPYFPGAANVEEGKRIFELMCVRGVWLKGTNILQDRVDPVQSSYKNSTIISDEDSIFLVDQNLWLIDRELLLKYPIPETWSASDTEANTCPDDKMLENLVKNGVKIVSSYSPTVRYYLGGISNKNGKTEAMRNGN